jgi:hypothetical protein
MLENRNASHLTLLTALACAAVAIAASCAAGMAQAPADVLRWKGYTNVRFQYSLCYPDGLLVPQGESANSDGQKFLAGDGGQLIVYGHNNVLNEPLRDAFAAAGSRLAGPSGKVTYKVLRPDWFVVSGTNGATVFYAKTLYSHGQFKSFELTYGAAAAAVYEPVIRRLAACFADLAR